MEKFQRAKMAGSESLPWAKGNDVVGHFLPAGSDLGITELHYLHT